MVRVHLYDDARRLEGSSLDQQVSICEISSPTIVIATPHRRNDVLEVHVRESLPRYNVVRLRERKDLSTEALGLLNPDFVFFPHWSWFIPQEVHSRFECVIFHMTDVPYGRGGSPLQNLIVRGHQETMLSALRCVKDFDAGPVYLKRPLSLAGTAEEILQRASALMESMIVEIVERRPSPIPQEGEIVEFKRRQPSQGNVADLDTAQAVYDVIRMLDADGYPPAFLEVGRLRVEFSRAVLRGDMVRADVVIKVRHDGE